MQRKKVDIVLCHHFFSLWLGEVGVVTEEIGQILVAFGVNYSKVVALQSQFHCSILAGGLDLALLKIIWTGLQSVYSVNCFP